MGQVGADGVVHFHNKCKPVISLSAHELWHCTKPESNTSMLLGIPEISLRESKFGDTTAHIVHFSRIFHCSRCGKVVNMSNSFGSRVSEIATQSAVHVCPDRTNVQTNGPNGYGEGVQGRSENGFFHKFQRHQVWSGYDDGLGGCQHRIVKFSFTTIIVVRVAKTVDP